MFKKIDDLGLTQEYDRSLYDDNNAKKNFKEKQFDGKKTIVDPVTGEILHSSQEAAKKKYHMKNKEGQNISRAWAKHSPESDHIVSLKEGHKFAKGNPFLTDEQFKTIMNQDSNFRVTSKSLNASKQDKNDYKLALDISKKGNKSEDLNLKGRGVLLGQKVKADVKLHSDFAKVTGKNVLNEAAYGAQEQLYNSVVPLISSGVNKMVKVATGEVDFEEASKEFGKEVIEVAVIGGVEQLKNDIIKVQISAGKIPLLKGLPDNQVNQIIQVSLIVKDAAVKYMNGEISGEEFFEEIGQKGTNMVVGLIGGKIGGEIGKCIGGYLGTMSLPVLGTGAGMVVGEVVGQIIGTVISTVTYSIIISGLQVYKNLDSYKQSEKMIKKLEDDIVREMSVQRDNLNKYLKEKYDEWDSKILEGFNLVINNSNEQNYDLNNINCGLNIMLNLFGIEVKHKSTCEYKKTFGETLELEI